MAARPALHHALPPAVPPPPPVGADEQHPGRCAAHSLHSALLLKSKDAQHTLLSPALCPRRPLEAAACPP